MAFPTLITIRPYKDAYICFDTYKFIDMVGKKTPIFKFVHKKVVNRHQDIVLHKSHRVVHARWDLVGAPKDHQTQKICPS